MNFDSGLGPSAKKAPKAAAAVDLEEALSAEEAEEQRTPPKDGRSAAEIADAWLREQEDTIDEEARRSAEKSRRAARDAFRRAFDDAASWDDLDALSALGDIERQPTRLR